MCGIFGATSIEQFETLYKLNSERGNFASSVMSYNDNYYTCVKHPGVPELKTVRFHVGDETMFLGHTQAPTSSKRDWSYTTSHPFECGDWMVAHNGIITNFEKLKRRYVNITHTNPVDSSIIPALLDCFIAKGIKGHHTLAIRETLELLEGTFAVWIYHKPSHAAYLARCSSTLFFDKEKKAFSSVEFPGSEPVPEGITHLLPTFQRSYIFEFNSPFFAVC